MSAFVVPPKPKNAKIPVITADELADALRAYLTATYPFSYTGQGIDGRDGATYISFYGNRTDSPSKRMKLEVTMYGKAARSWQSKLFNMQFDVGVYDDPDDLMELAKLDVKTQSAIRAERTRYLLIEPLADRSISISRILRWDNGRPVLEA
jgi:hypothetical protein